MALLIVSAAASHLFGDFLMLVSVSGADGKPATGLGAKASEGPAGFYTLQLAKNDIQPTLPNGHYVFSVAVAAGRKAVNHGQTVAVGDMVS